MKKILLLIALFPAFSFAQDVAELIKLYYNKLPAERIHIHFDKDAYVAGETIWFKSYLQTGLTGDTISTSLFLELSDPNGRVIQIKTLPIAESTTHGNFDLPDSLRSGYYTLRAYTSWMLNFEEDFLYNKKIYIYNSHSPIPNNSREEIFDVGFFPEGGSMIADIVNYVAVKATNGNGYPVDLTGTIFDSKGNSITDMKTTHDGMGRFIILPAAGETYTAEVKFSNGKIAKLTLPAAKEKGIVMHVDENPQGKRITIQKSEGEPDGDITLVGRLADNVAFVRKIHLEKKPALLILPVKDLSSGILMITLLDKDFRPLVERLTFVNNNDYLQSANLDADTLQKNRRALNVFTFSIPDSLEGNYSVAVTDNDKAPASGIAEDIVSRFLLTSYLRGYIHNPRYYFKNNDKGTKDALDLVMMTNGWRKINWEQIRSAHYPAPAYTPLSFITISGKVLTENKKQPVKEGMLNFIYRSLKDSSAGVSTAFIDAEGRFELPSLIFSDTATFVYNLNTKKKSKQIVNLVLDRNTIRPSNPYLAPINIIGQELSDSLKQKMKKIQDDLQDYSAFLAKAVTLKEIKITGRKKTATQLVQERYTSGPFSGNFGRVVDLISNPVPGVTSLISFLRFNFPRIRIAGTTGNYEVQSSLVTSIMGPPQVVTVFFNEVQWDINAIDNIPIDEIAMIKYENNFALAPAGGPALIIYQKKPEDMTKPYSSVLPRFFFPGYSITREFYSPNYDMPDSRHAAPDTRSTLFWDPEILLDKEHMKHKIRFYNNDDCKNMRVIIEGVTAEGRFCRIEKVF